MTMWYTPFKKGLCKNIQIFLIPSKQQVGYVSVIINQCHFFLVQSIYSKQDCDRQNKQILKKIFKKKKKTDQMQSNHLQSFFHRIKLGEQGCNCTTAHQILDPMTKALALICSKWRYLPRHSKSFQNTTSVP